QWTKTLNALHTPSEIETLMSDCWNSIPSLRPSFGTLMTRLEKLLSPAYRRREQALNDAMWTQYSKYAINSTSRCPPHKKWKKRRKSWRITPKSRSSYLRID
ncbi:Uncharacterized protein FKW44_014940, partial [Caligus rogercresseyi]